MTIGDLIKEFRKTNKMTLEVFAERAGISKAYVSMLERNRNSRNKPIVPSLATVKSVADVMCLNLNEVLERIDSKPPNAWLKLSIPDDRLAADTPLERETLTTFRKLNYAGQNLVSSYAKDLAELGRYKKSKY